MMKSSGELLEFPCHFPIKVFGLANDSFELAVLTIVHKHVAKLAEDAISMRHSKDKKYLALTIRVEVNSQPQLDGLYRELTAHSEILTVL